MKSKNSPIFYKSIFKSIATITVKILPYHAQFLADPFIVYLNNKYHIFCEVFVSQKDKRIVHLESIDTIEWNYVADILTDDDYSFPSVYKKSTNCEILIVPQISKTNRIRAYNYRLDTQVILESWSIDFSAQTRDLLFLEHPVTKQWFLLFGMIYRGRSALAASKVYGDFSDGKKPSFGKPHIITKRSFVEGAFSKLIPLKRLTFRPAGNPFGITREGFCLPVQATMSGKYGEMFAIVKFNWSFRTKGVSYISPKNLGNGFERSHHISQTLSDAGVFACFDVIPDGCGNRWELRVVKIVETQ